MSGWWGAERRAVYLLGLSPRGLVPAGFTGTLFAPDQRVRVMNTGRFDAVIADIPSAAEVAPGASAVGGAARSAERRVHHDQLVRLADAAADGALFPVPYGVAFGAYASMADVIERNGDEVAAFFERVRGARSWMLEFNGVGGMSALGSVLSGTSQFIRQTATLPAGGAGPAGEGGQVARAAVLIPKVHRRRFQMAYGRLAAESLRAGILSELTGPWPSWPFTPRLAWADERGGGRRVA